MRPLSLGLVLCVALASTASRRVMAADTPKAATVDSVSKLESDVFRSRLTKQAVDRELSRLATIAQREDAAGKLVRQAQGYQRQIADWARRCQDREVEQLCAEIVAALDRVCDNTSSGHELADQYHRRAATLLPRYWQRFRSDPLDRRAAAMIVHAEPGPAFEFVSKTGDRYDPVRFLLLRMRELGADEFVQKQLPGYPATAVLHVLPEVFPVPLSVQPSSGLASLQAAAAHRVVGHSVLDVIEIGSEEFPSGRMRGTPQGVAQDSMPEKLPRIANMFLARQRIYLYKFPTILWYAAAHSHAFLQLGGQLWDPNQTGQPTFVPYPTTCFNSDAVPGLAPLPQLDLSKEQIRLVYQNDGLLAPWAATHVPEGYRAGLPLRELALNEQAPRLIEEKIAEEVVAPVDGDQTQRNAESPRASLLILPPRIKAAIAVETRATAELINERLGQEINRAGLAIVVDRGHLGQMLAERKLAAVAGPALVSFDVMLQLEVDITQLTQLMQLRLIKTSTGNTLAQRQFEWPIDEHNVPALVEVCRRGILAANEDTAGRLKVRLLGSEVRVGGLRTAPLTQRLMASFHEALEQSPSMLLIEHLEAGSTLEESLLDLAGLSHLPGGRRFGPQADATVDLRVVETDATGKTFAETPIEVSFRVRRGDQAEGDWTGTAGLVKTFDHLKAEAWKKLAAQLGAIQPTSAADIFDQFEVRHGQAAAELQAAQVASDGGERLARSEAAVKLDPMFDDAVDANLQNLYAMIISGALTQQQTSDLAHRTIRDAAGYISRLPNQANDDADPAFAHRINRARQVAYNSLDYTRVGLLQRNWREAHLEFEDYETLDLLRQMYEDEVRHLKILEDDSRHKRLPMHIYRGMVLRGTALAERHQWIDGLLETGHPQPDGILVSAFALAVEETQFERARSLVEKLRQRCAGRKLDEVNGERLLLAVLMLDDQRMLDDLNRWATRSGDLADQPIVWPELAGLNAPLPELPATIILHSAAERDRSLHAISPLVASQRRMYVLLAEQGSALTTETFRGQHHQPSPVAIGYVPIDSRGGAIGELATPTDGTLLPSWSELKLLASPIGPTPPRICAAAFLDGKLCLSTANDGLLLFDEKTKKWKVYGLEQGLPILTVRRLWALDDRTLLCSGFKPSGTLGAIFKFDVQTGDVTVVREDISGAYTDLDALWHDGEAWRARTRERIWSNVFSPRATPRPSGETELYGWPATRDSASGRTPMAAAETGERRFFSCRKGLIEFDAKGKQLRAWGQPSYVLYSRNVGSYFSTYIPVPANSPVHSDAMVRCGDALVFVPRYPKMGLLAYFPQMDTWYGPVGRFNGVHQIASGDTIWIGTADGLIQVDLDDVVTAAKAAGRVMTTTEYLQFRQRQIDELVPVERGKIYFAMRDFDRSRTELLAVLDQEPENPDALELLGDLHNRWCLNEPALAGAYYERLGKVSNRARALRGRYAQSLLLRDDRNSSEALAAATQALADFPDMTSIWRQAFGDLKDDLERRSATKR